MGVGVGDPDPRARPIAWLVIRHADLAHAHDHWPRGLGRVVTVFRVICVIECASRLQTERRVPPGFTWKVRGCLKTVPSSPILIGVGRFVRDRTGGVSLREGRHGATAHAAIR